jgi:hypothetical protein
MAMATREAVARTYFRRPIDLDCRQTDDVEGRHIVKPLDLYLLL